ncbi:hypothetical protein L1887_17276 [Cichorium endivia]|nr:hypothetical protein L1887_17276 [Cichorium endivia]
MKDFIWLERVNGKIVNILDGLELHSGVFSSVEQNRIVDFVYELQEKGKNGKLKEHTYTIQFGCCYNATLPTTSHLEACQFVAANHKAQLCVTVIQWLERFASKAPDLDKKVRGSHAH